MAIKCESCGENKSPSDFMPSTGKYWPNGRINVCYDCIAVSVDGDDLNDVDRLFQHANMAFFPDEWRKLWRREKERAFRKYAEIYNEINYYKYDWGEQNDKISQLARTGVIETELSELKPSLIEKLKITWGEMNELDLLRMEKYFNSALKDYNVKKETERDLLRKIVRLSIIIDNDLMRGETDKVKVDLYDKLMKTALNTLEASKQKGITSISQIIEFIEKNGFKPTYYNGIPKDEIDMILEDIKEYLRDLVQGEVNLGEIYERKRAQILALEDEDKVKEEE